MMARSLSSARLARSAARPRGPPPYGITSKSSYQGILGLQARSGSRNVRAAVRRCAFSCSLCTAIASNSLLYSPATTAVGLVIHAARRETLHAGHGASGRCCGPVRKASAQRRKVRRRWYGFVSAISGNGSSSQAQHHAATFSKNRRTGRLHVLVCAHTCGHDRI